MDEEACVHPLNASDPLEDSSYFVSHGFGPFWLVWTRHEVRLFLDLACVWADDTIKLHWLYRDVLYYGVTDGPVFSCLDFCHVCEGRGWNFAQCCDCDNVVVYDVLDLELP